MKSTQKKGSGVQDSEPFKRLGRRSPHARSRMPAFGACIAADSPTPFGEVCLRFGLMTGPSNQFWTETILRQGFWATRPLQKERLSLLGSASVTVWCTSHYEGITPPASRLRSTINTGIASYLSGHLGVTSSCCKTRLKRSTNLTISRSTRATCSYEPQSVSHDTHYLHQQVAPFTGKSR